MSAVMRSEESARSRYLPAGLGLDSESARWKMAEALERRGIRDASVLDAMATIARHLFVDPALASRAYQDEALPIGLEQTISKPSIVSRMIELAAQPIPFNERRHARVLEIGSGCGYQAAVLGHVFGSVVSIERLQPLHDLARRNLRRIGNRNVRLVYGDVSRDCHRRRPRRRNSGSVIASDSYWWPPGGARQPGGLSATSSGRAFILHRLAPVRAGCSSFCAHGRWYPIIPQ